MAAGGDVLEAVREVQTGVVEAQAQLLSPTPEAVENTGLHLERAAVILERLAQRLKTGGIDEAGQRELRATLEALRREINRLRVLLEGAAALRLAWARMLYATAYGYTPQGEPAPPQVGRRLAVEG
jgi:hypothetical protein